MIHPITKEDLLAKRDTFTEEEFGILRNTLGSIVLSWAQMEASLNLLGQIVFQLVGATPESKDVPFECSKKIAYLGGALTRNDDFKPFAVEGAALLCRINDLKRIRDALIHGYICAHDRAGRTVVFQRDRAKKGQRQEVLNRYGLDSLTNASKEAGELALGMAKFVQRFADVLPSED